MESGQQDNDLIVFAVSRIVPEKTWKVFRLLMRPYDFPQYFPEIKECKLLDKNEDGILTQWRIEVGQIALAWTQKDTYEVSKFKIHFSMMSGDLEKFEGEWGLKELPSGSTEVTVQIRIKIGIPMVEKVMASIVRDQFKKFYGMLLNGIDEVLRTKRYKNIGDRKVSDLRGFAVIGHPYNLQHLIRYFKFFKPDVKLPSEEFLLKLFAMAPAYNSCDINNFKSKTGQEVSGHFIVCPIIPDMLRMHPEKVVEKVIGACKVAEEYGTGIATLGGFTSIAGEMYAKDMIRSVNIPITTGNTLTVATVLDGVTEAARLMDVDLNKAHVTIIGGTGDIGGACAKILSETVSELTITGRNDKNLMESERILSYYGKARIKTSKNNNEAVRGADIVIAAASASSAIVDINSFKPGAVICDVGYPKNISYGSCERKDIFIFSGGILALPSEFNLGFDVGLPSPRVLYGCFSEAILLDLEERYENFSWGKGNITREKVDYIRGVARKHGFDLAPFFWGYKQMSHEEIAEIAKMKSAGSAHT